MTFITDDIISENGLTATTLNCLNLNTTIISATTFYGNSSNVIVNKLSSNIPNNSVLFNDNNNFSGSTNLIYSGGTLFSTGTTRLDGQFYLIDSSSAKLRIQWFGSITAGATPGIIWTNMPVGITTWLHQTSGTITGDATYIVDLTEYTEYRFFFSRQVQGFTTSVLNVQYSFDNVTWEIPTLATQPIGTGTGVRDSGWLPILANARTFIYRRLVGVGGNGTADPRLSPPTILFR